MHNNDDLKKLLEKYDKLRSVANRGSGDKRFLQKYKFLKRVAGWKWFKIFSTNTYDLPFASNRIRKDIRSTLINILRLHEINYWRTERSNEFSKEAMKTINEYLAEIPKLPSLEKRFTDNFLGILGVVVGVIAIIASNWSNVISPDFAIVFEIISIVFGLIVMLPFLTFYSTNKILNYLSEKDLQEYWMEKLVIKDLRHKIITELVELNDRTYAELDKKY
ncbi:Putative CRISPR-associated protein Cas5 [Nitrosotalea sinensis]|uniref:CRISPR-associated protein Cas5 n=1 Tax=Nitrosotalea sinensis TaxID=1499975 RepID=A0A2H1EIW0_9ARCH|nr:hypothetical protein [Candidatus Nitrosotalea sinensis]SHO47629.1 Putative CRISPR-associated protein Cas5 [Candidatus Nitrosotalea sinensis]